MNPLQASGKPYFFRVKNQADFSLKLPTPQSGIIARLWARSLTEMQKEALVICSDGNLMWRLSSDEGPYLNGDDVSPCPLSFFTTGMVCSYLNEIIALAGQRKINLNAIKLVLDNYYTMEGSALQGTMVGGALPVELEAVIASDAGEGLLQQLVVDAVSASPVNGLMQEPLSSLFTLTHNNQPLTVGRVNGLASDSEPDPGNSFDPAIPEETLDGEPLVLKTKEAAELHGNDIVDSNRASSLSENQSRILHIRGICQIRPDGIREVEQYLFNPKGSVFRVLCEETPGHGGQGRAPDAISYVAAGIGFCFMTQFGRYARITGKDLQGYHIVQDIHFSQGAQRGGPDNRAGPDR